MEHFYNEIQGHFNFQSLYSDIVKWAKDGYHFVEIGAWHGCSSSYMAVEIINSGKKIQFDIVDCFDDELCDDFTKNMKRVENHYKLIRGYSKDVSEQYKNSSLDFVFIDGNHDYETVMDDIKSWFPKIKKGGMIGGHDFEEKFEGVYGAVNEFFKNDYKVNVTSWIHEKK
jgi:predicted O-methyltransferase YrrM